MANYTIQSHNGTGLYLQADGSATARGNISIRARIASSLDQTWRVDELKNGMRTRIFSGKSTNATGYCFNVNRAQFACDLYTYMNNYPDTLLELELLSGTTYYIKSVHHNKYLTANGTGASSTVSWLTKNSTTAQQWKFSAVSNGAGPFSIPSFANGLNESVRHNTSNSVAHFFKLTTTQKIRYAISSKGMVDIGNATFIPAGKTVVARTNGSFFGTATGIYEGIYKLGSDLHYNGEKLSSYDGQKAAITNFIADGTHTPNFCIPASGAPNILWFKNYSDLISKYSSYEYLFPIGHALVMNGKMVYDNNLATDQNIQIPATNAYGPVASHTGSMADIVWDDQTILRQRTLIGYMAGNYYLVVTNSMSIMACALMMKELGCTWAASLDGGNSTTMRANSKTIVQAGRPNVGAVCACSN